MRLSLLSNIFPNQNDQVERFEGEDGFNRISFFNGIGAILIAPSLAYILYFFNAPKTFVYLALSYTGGFVVYYLICRFTPFFKQSLLYMLFFHLNVITIIAFQEMYLAYFTYKYLFLFLIYYLASVIIIQRLYPAILYHVLVTLLFVDAGFKMKEPVIDVNFLLALFILFGLSNILMLYARNNVLRKINDYSQYLKKIMNNPGSGYILFTMTGNRKIIDYNNEAFRYFTQNDEEESDLNKDFFDLFSNSEIKTIKELKRGMRFTKVITFNQYNRRYDIEFNISRITLKNGVLWLANLNDVTQQSVKREELEISERKYRNLYHKNRAGVFTIDHRSVIIDGNEVFFKMLDNTLQIGDPLFTTEYDDDWELILDTLNQTENIQNYQTQFYLNNGEMKTFIFSWYLDKLTGSIEGSVIDLTSSQKTAQALKQSEQKYKMIFEESNDAILLLSGDRIIDANRRALELFVEESKNLRKLELFDLSWDKSSENKKEYLDLKSSLSYKKSIKFNWLLKAKEERIEAEIVLIEIMLENKLYYQCVIHDLTEQNKLAEEKMRAEFAEETNIRLEAEIKERIKAEKQLQEQFLRTKAILDSSSNTFLLTLTVDKKISSYNLHSEQYFSQLFKTQLKKGDNFAVKLKKHLSPKFLRLFNLMFIRVLNGKSRQFEVLITSVEGNEFWMEVYMSAIYDTEGNVGEVSLVAHDITEKKKSTIEIEESLKEKEVLLKEIHHRVKNNLQVISSILNLQSSFAQDEKTLEILQESRNRVRSMAIIHENLYKTEDFSSIKFGDYLYNLTTNLIASYRISGDVKLIADINDVDLELDQAIPCGLFVNEVITNALKYAWIEPAGREISIKLKQQKSRVVLEISDNGVGLPKPFEEMNSDTLGLQLIITLAEQLDGDLKVDRKKGTKYLLKFDNIKPNHNVKN